MDISWQKDKNAVGYRGANKFSGWEKNSSWARFCVDPGPGRPEIWRPATIKDKLKPNPIPTHLKQNWKQKLCDQTMRPDKSSQIKSNQFTSLFLKLKREVNEFCMNNKKSETKKELALQN